MYYILKDQYLLRGWEKLPYGVLDRRTGSTAFLDKPAFDTLEACDGTIDFSLPFLPAYMRENIEGLEKAGYIRSCEGGETLADEQKYHQYPNRYMAGAQWSITGKCNCKCRHCLLSAPDAKYGELSHEDVMRIVQELADAGIMQLSITGGEPLIRPDFWEILDAIREKGMILTTLSTNGLLVNERLLSGLQKLGLHPDISMSFDGIGYHDWLRGIDGAEKAVRRAFMLCRDRGFSTSAAMCLWKGNVHTLRESINYLASAGCGSFKTQSIDNLGAWLAGGYAETQNLSDAETNEAILSYLPDFYADLPPMELKLGGLFTADGRNPDAYRIPAVQTCESIKNVCLCNTARTYMYISAEGKLFLCMGVADLDEMSGNYPDILTTSLSECLTDSAYMRLNDTRVSAVLSHNEKCTDCKHRLLCLGGCRAGGIMSHPGDILGADERACAMYREGWIKRVIETVGRLRPGAKCRELAWLQEHGRVDELL